jgi:hypothetical protein
MDALTRMSGCMCFYLIPGQLLTAVVRKQRRIGQKTGQDLFCKSWPFFYYHCHI